MTEDEEKLLETLLSKKREEAWQEREAREKLLQARKLEEREKLLQARKLEEKEYDTAKWAAYRNNFCAHKEYGPLPNLPTKPIIFDPHSRDFAPDLLDPKAYYLCLKQNDTTSNAKWFLGYGANYLKEQRRWIIMGWYNSVQVELLLQIHEITLPCIPNYLVVRPTKPQWMIDKENASDEDEDEM